MGLLSWLKGNKEPTSAGAGADGGGGGGGGGGGSGVSTTVKPSPMSTVSSEKAAEELPDVNGAVEVSRPAPNVDVTVFEFGSIAASSDKVTLAGYCPVSDELEPCRWEILPATASDAPQFRVVF